MAGHFAAIVKSPITDIILISVMTGLLEHLLSLSIVVLVAQLTSDLLKSHPIYESLLDRLLTQGTHKYEGSNKKTLLEAVVHRNSEIDGKCIKGISWPNNCLVVDITRGAVEILPKESTEILAGDYLTFMTDQSSFSEILEQVVKLAHE